jgi:EAL domain-containing protein (putative c-di-GMP-specific phosphodiesterase class I)
MTRLEALLATSVLPTSDRAFPGSAADKSVGAKRRILLVDDDEAVLSLFKSALELGGFDVHAARDGDNALQNLQAASFDAIVSDVSMPGMNGIQLLRAIRRFDLDIPVILVTGNPQIDTAIRAVELGALRYLTKPVPVSQLVEVVGYAVQIHHLAKIKEEALTLLKKQSQRFSERASLEVAFERALSSLWIAFQPIVSCSQKRVFAYEALVRSHEPALSNPRMLIEAAEALGAVHRLGRKIREVLMDALISLDPDLFMFLNLHPLDLLDEELFTGNEPISVHAQRIVLEITERARLDGIDGLKRRLEQLRLMGYRLAIDDLGAGYSGLTSFVRINPEFVKIDMNLVRDIHIDSTKTRLVRSLIDLCKGMGISVVLEGVETTDERECLLEIGADLLQGFVISHPSATLPATDIKLC